MLRQTNKNQPFPMAWPEFFLALPRSIAQSSAFGVSYRRDRRPAFDAVELFVWGGRQIVFTGQALDQFDLDVWLFCLDFSKSSGFKNLSLTRRQICRGLLIGEGKKEIKRVESSILRLFSATLKIKEPKKEPLFFSLLQSDDGEKGKLNIGFAPDLMRAMQKPVFLGVQRIALKLPLSKKLQVIFSSQDTTKKHQLLIENLQFLAAQTALSKKEFARKLRSAMAELERMGNLESWEIDSRKVTYFIRGIS